jgi:hypothetical protein
VSVFCKKKSLTKISSQNKTAEKYALNFIACLKMIQEFAMQISKAIF